MDTPWLDIGTGAAQGAGTGASVAGGWGAAAGAVAGGIKGYFSGTEKQKRNATAERYAEMEAGDSRQRTLLELVKEKKKKQWQMEFGDAFRNLMLNQAGNGV